MPETAKWIGGFIRWLLKGCKTLLKDEIEGSLDASWGGTYEIENYIIGVVTVVIIIFLVAWLAF
jgi:hypothetical protein